MRTSPVAHLPFTPAAGFGVAEEDRIRVEDLRILGRYDHESLPLDRTVGGHTPADRLRPDPRPVMVDLVTAADPPPAGARAVPAS